MLTMCQVVGSRGREKQMTQDVFMQKAEIEQVGAGQRVFECVCVREMDGG